MKIGIVSLTTDELQHQVEFYRDVLGFNLLEQNGSKALLGAGSCPLIELVEHPGAEFEELTTGLYHFAILLPDEISLARALAHLAGVEGLLEGTANHLVSQSLYLQDPDGNGIEIYADLPKSTWPYDRIGRLKMDTKTLDIDHLMDMLEADGNAWAGMPEGTRIGHVHLHVKQIPDSEAYYMKMLGMDLIQRYGPAAAFLSSGGYHHLVGINTWNGVNAPAPKPTSLGLRWFEVCIPDQAALDTILERLRAAGKPVEELDGGWLTRDPSQNGILLRVSAD